MNPWFLCSGLCHQDVPRTRRWLVHRLFTDIFTRMCCLRTLGCPLLIRHFLDSLPGSVHRSFLNHFRSQRAGRCRERSTDSYAPLVRLGRVTGCCCLVVGFEVIAFSSDGLQHNDHFNWICR